MIKVKNKDAKYPQLMEGSDGLVVLMTNAGWDPKNCEGFVVSPDSQQESQVGDATDCWWLPYFKPFEGEIKLKSPSLMEGKDGLVVLMLQQQSRCGDGFVIKATGNYKVGQRSNIWNMDVFKPFEGEIALSND